MGITQKRFWSCFFLSAVLACSLSAQTNMLSKTGTLRWGPLRGGQEAQQISVDITGLKTLTLLATGYSFGQAVWGEAVLVAQDGSTTNLAALKPLQAQVAWGNYWVNKGPDGKPLSIAGKKMNHGLFAHADSCVIFPINGRYVRLEARIGINDTAGKAGNVFFEIGDQDLVEWRRALEQFRRGFTPECISGLRTDLKAARKSGGASAAKAKDYEKLLEHYEKTGDEIRKKLGTEPESLKEQVTGFMALVRDIHFLKLDAPLLFVKRHAYFSPHIYDDYASWHPGGGIYIIENPSAPLEQQVVRAVIDPKTPETLGEGVYRDPELSYDAKKIVFAFKGEGRGDTSLYEIGLDNKGLRRVTNPGRDVQCMNKPDGLWGEGQHDISPCYLPDGRIAFISTRASGLVMCFNNFSATLHSINPDGTDLKCLSVNNVTEFDPSVLPDGRILFGRWEYVDKTALYMQSLWVVNPDGSGETAVFANNLAKPTSVLDARPVPGTDLIVASLTPHNGQSVGAIAMIDPKAGKNSLDAITNFTPEYPTEMDQGLVQGPSDPWPVSEDVVLISDNALIHGPHGVVQMIDRYGFRTTIRRDAAIGCFSPMLVKPTKAPPVRFSMIRQGEPAKFLVHDIYDGMPGVKKGEVKYLRVLETTTRLSGVPPGGRWWNQALLISWQGSYDVKRFIGVVPVEADGSAYFEAPPGKALYVQALDKDKRLLQSMRTFVQAVPGVTRSCRGCHLKDETKAPVNDGRGALALKKDAVKPAPESWGNGCLDYPRMVQPVLDRNCVKCHGGEKGIAGGLDFSGGWTWAFSISYETLLKNTLTGFLNCNNSNVKTAEILDPRTHGSGVGLLGKIVLGTHSSPEGMSPKDRELLLAWMDGNCNYHGVADYTEHATCGALLELKAPLLAEMEKAGCVKCHQPQLGNDWINLQNPERSRILRAPLVKTETGIGLAWCRERKAKQVRFPLVNQSVQPPDVFKPYREAAPDTTGTVVTPFEGTQAPAYRAMLAIIEKGREEALKKPRVDMPGAVPKKGIFRELPPLGSPIETRKVE